MEKVKISFIIMSDMLLLSVLCCVVKSTQAKVNLITLSPSQIRSAITDHNRARKNVVPSSSNMAAIAWRENLAVSAARHAKKCVYENSKPSSRAQGRFKDVGENIYVTTAVTFLQRYPIISGAVEWWSEEKQHYSYKKGQCRLKCDSYLQIIWSKGKYFGCSVALCTNITVPENYLFGPVYSKASFVVCHYSATVKTFLGEKPYRSGKPCTECGERSVCKENLCARKNQVVEPDPLPVETVLKAAAARPRKGLMLLVYLVIYFALKCLWS